MRNFLKVSLFLTALIPVSFVFAEEGWVIKNFESNISITHDGVVSIEETINVDFGTQAKHGIFRDLPHAYATEDGVLRTGVKIVSIGNENGSSIQYETIEDAYNIRLKIGDPNRTIVGVQTYKIRYEVLGILRSFDEYDEIYWNATGNNWGVQIERSTATVTLTTPGVLQASCYVGRPGEDEDCGIQEEKESGVRFASSRALSPGEGLTIAVGFAKGMVPIISPEEVSHNDTSDVSPIVAIVSFLLVFLAAAVLIPRIWWLHGRDLFYERKSLHDPDSRERIMPLFARESIMVEYDPPEKLRPGELGVLMDESADTLDVTATIVDLSVRGYITIKEIPKKWFLGSTDYELIRTAKKPDELLEYEKLLIAALFKDREVSTSFSSIFKNIEREKENFGGKSHVKTSELKNSFYKDLADIKTALYEEVKKKDLFVEDPQKARVKYGAYAGGMVVLSLLFLFFGTPFFGGALLGAGIALLLSGIPALILAIKGMPKRTAYGRELYAKARGYKQFVSGTEKYRQPFFEKENLFMEVLPYAILFGVTKKLATAMKEMGVQTQSPAWYSGNAPFNAAVFASTMGDFSNSLGSAIASAPGGSGSGGGGFSGGGSGGGGGGSW